MPVKKKKSSHEDKKRELLVVDDPLQAYARVTKMLGNGRLMAMCSDGLERLCKIRGKMHKREWIQTGDLVLVALRNFQDEKADVIFRYRDAEVHQLQKMGEALPVTTARATDDDTIEDDAGVDFADDDWDRI
jgi:translation initiation factor 1A